MYEQGTPETTFGFGVALAGAHPAQPGGRRPRHPGATSSPPVTRTTCACCVGDDAARVPDGALVGIARTELLAVLDPARREGRGASCTTASASPLDDLDADLVVVADGVNSATRTDLADRASGHEIETRARLYLWAGTDFALDDGDLRAGDDRARHVRRARLPLRARPQHVPRSRSTRPRGARPGSTRPPSETAAPDESDTAALAYLQDAFAEHLGGHRLIGNRTRWLRFRTVHLRRAGPRQRRAARRRRPHRALLGRLGHQARHGGRDRAASTPSPRRPTWPTALAALRARPQARGRAACRTSPGAAGGGGTRSRTARTCPSTS